MIHSRRVVQVGVALWQDAQNEEEPRTSQTSWPSDKTTHLPLCPVRLRRKGLKKDRRIGKALGVFVQYRASMPEKSTFGIDAKFLDEVDFDLARRRVINDFRSDFILAPHFSCIFVDAFDALNAALVLIGNTCGPSELYCDYPMHRTLRWVRC